MTRIDIQHGVSVSGFSGQSLAAARATHGTGIPCVLTVSQTNCNANRTEGYQAAVMEIT
ncbi:hypothetical protein SZ54_3067 [Rhizobium sp. UR51a]|nr:hypothetical protein SZ54_3067 [Rhizobium sp. UR51a]